jgi:hypothetical protein
MNDGVRRSLLVARVAKLQVEDEAEFAADVRVAQTWVARPGWGTSSPSAGEWVGEQPSRMTGPVMESALKGTWAVVDRQLQGESSEG